MESITADVDKKLRVTYTDTAGKHQTIMVDAITITDGVLEMTKQECKKVYVRENEYTNLKIVELC